MKTLLSLLVVIGAASSAQAFDQIGLTTAVSIGGPTSISLDASGCFDNSKKLVLAAKEDALAFVASDGQLRGVQLQQALHAIRSQAPALAMSDMDLAREIIAY
jgi:conserverd hypothetical protein